MKVIKSLQWWQALGVAIIVGILCHIAFGWSAWGAGFLMLFIWAAEKFTRLLYIPAAIIIVFAVMSSYFPLTSSKGTWGIIKLDLFTSRQIDSVQVKADILLETEKNLQKDALLDDYHDLLKKGQVEQAKALLDSIDNLFYPKKVKEEVVTIQPEPAPTPVPMVKDSIFTKGEYFIDVQGMTPFSILIFPSTDGCARYSLSSDRYNYQVYFSDGEVVQSGPNVIVKHRPQPKFRLFSASGDKVKLVVS